MSISEADSIDIVAARPDSNVVQLVIADHLTWDDIEAHTRQIQAKINTYVAFIESGQLAGVKEPAIPPSPVIRIVIAAKHTPPAAASRFLDSARAFLAAINIELEVNAKYSEG